MKTRVVITGRVPPSVRIGVPQPTLTASISGASLRRRHTIEVMVQSLPPGLRDPWRRQKLEFGVLDLLRCCSRYFFIGGWRAGRPDGWIASLFVSDYLSSRTSIQWEERNSNVARWLSEISGVGIACMMVEQLGGANIDLNAKGAAGPDYHAELTLGRRLTRLFFEVKGSSSWPIPSDTLQRARNQVAGAKSSNFALVFAAFVNHRGSSSGMPSTVCVEDPPASDEVPASPFQRHLSVLASTLSWAGEVELGRNLAHSVINAEDGCFWPAGHTKEMLAEFFHGLGEDVFGLLHQPYFEHQLPVSDGILRFSAPTVGLRQLRDHFMRNEIESFHLKSAEIRESSDFESIGPDGSSLKYGPLQQS